MTLFAESMGALFIDLPSGDVLIPYASNVLGAAEIAKNERGRLRMRVGDDLDTTNPMVGCICLGDWRLHRIANTVLKERRYPKMRMLLTYDAPTESVTVAAPEEKE